MKFKAIFLRLICLIKTFWLSVLGNKTGSLSLLVAMASVYVAWQIGHTSNKLVERQVALQEAQYKPIFTTRWEQGSKAKSGEGESFKEPLFILNQGGPVSVKEINLIFYLDFNYHCSFSDKGVGEEDGYLYSPYRSIEIALHKTPYVLDYRNEYKGTYVVDFILGANDELLKIKRGVERIKGNSKGAFSLNAKIAIRYSDQTGSGKIAFIEGGKVEYDITKKELVTKLLDVAFLRNSNSESIYSNLSEVEGDLCELNLDQKIYVKPDSADVVKLL